MAGNKNGEQEAERIPGMSAELAEVLRATGVRGYDQGHSAGALWWEREPWTSARKAVGEFPGERTSAGVELRFVLERAHATGYERGYEDRMEGRLARVSTDSMAAPEVGDRGRRLWEQLREVQREQGGAAYLQGYDEGAAGKTARPQARDLPGVERGLDAAWDLMHDVRARGYERGHAEGVSGAMKRDVAEKRARDAVSYSAVARFGKHNQAREAELARRSRERPAAERAQGEEGRDTTEALHPRGDRDRQERVGARRNVGGLSR